MTERNTARDDDLDWRAAFDLARTELDTTIAKLNLNKDKPKEQARQ